MIRGLRTKLKEINDEINDFEKNPALKKGKEVDVHFHSVIDLLKGHELTIDDAIEVQMTVNRWSNLSRAWGGSKEITILKEMVNNLLTH